MPVIVQPGNEHVLSLELEFISTHRMSMKNWIVRSRLSNDGWKSMAISMPIGASSS
jgi:hypothetical protein